MITVRLKGGMGNQMFQYAFAKGMAARLNTEAQMDCSLLLDRARGDDFVYRDYDLSIFDIGMSCVKSVLVKSSEKSWAQKAMKPLSHNRTKIY